jgi:lysophospholipase L1-like esterase
MTLRRILHIALVIAMAIPLVSHSASASLASVSIPAHTNTHHVYIIGDSLTVGPELFASLSRRVTRTKKWHSALVNAKVGRTIPQGVAVLKKARFRNPTAIVVALGTNDVLSRREASYPAKAIDDFMKAAQGKPVLWLNLEFSPTRPDWRSRGARFNKELRKATTRWPNLEIADWDKFFVSSGASRFIQDGIHLTVTGYRTRATFMVSQFSAWADRLWKQFTTTTTSTTTLPPTSTTEEPSPTTIDPNQATTTIAATVP